MPPARRFSWLGVLTGLWAVSVAQCEASYCEPSDACWPDASAWASLNATVDGQLSSPFAQREPGLFENASYLVYPNWRHAEGHTDSPLALPALAVTALSQEHVSATVRFAAQHHLRLSVKSSGHTYTGRSTAANSLLLSLRQMTGIQFHDAFDDGCGTNSSPPAVTVQPGVTFGVLYPEVDAQGYVIVGGGGPTVSAAGGYLQGGGHSPVGRALGLGVDNVLRIDIVLPNATLVSVTPCTHPSLWWALRGGGGGTFGIVVAATHQLHPNPGFVSLDAGYPNEPAEGGNVSAWLASVLDAQPKISANWSCYAGVFRGQGNDTGTSTWNMSCLHFGKDLAAAQKGIAPLRAAFDAAPSVGAFWSVQEYSSFWAWKNGDSGGDSVGVSSVLSGRILPAQILSNPQTATAVVDAVMSTVASGIDMHLGLLLGGAVSETYKDSAVSQWMRQGLWHVTAAGSWADAETSDEEQQAIARKTRSFGNALRAIVPKGGSYLNEDDFEEPQWQTSFFGDNVTYNKLLAIKRQLDPNNLLCCHNCVGYNSTVGCDGTRTASA